MLKPDFESIQVLRRSLARHKPDEFNAKYRINGNLELAFFWQPADDQIVRGKEDLQDRWYRRDDSGIRVHEAPKYTESADAALKLVERSGLKITEVLPRIRFGADSVEVFISRGFSEQRALAMALVSVALTEMASN